jgi:Ca2+-transporting ATPase
MGICGTQVAMNASDIVLLDDNFTSIVSATKWGRNVLNTIRKFLQFQLGINAAAIIITLVGSAVSEKSPLNTIQLLLVNLIMDSLGALALASDDPDAAIMTTPPQRKTDSVVTRNMWEYIGVQAFYQTSSCIVLMYGADKWIAPDWTVHTDPQDLYMDPDGITPSARTNTMVFLAFILMQITNLICTRTLNGELNIFSKFWKNPMFLYMEGAILIIVCSAVGFAYRAFGCTTLSGYEWAICIIIALLNLPVVFLSRVAFNIYKGKRGVGQVADLKQDTTKTKFDRDDLEEDNVMKSHTSLTAKDATRDSQSNIVEVFRKIKVDAPMKTKSQSLNSLRSS